MTETTQICCPTVLEVRRPTWVSLGGNPGEGGAGSLEAAGRESVFRLFQLPEAPALWPVLRLQGELSCISDLASAPYPPDSSRLACPFTGTPVMTLGPPG